MYNIYRYQLMRSLLKLRTPFSSKKLGIADTAKVIQDKILGITQVVSTPLSRMMLNNSARSFQSVTVSPEWWDSTRCKPVRWSSSDPGSGGWPSTSKPIMSVSSSSETIGNLSIMQRNPGGRYGHQDWCYCRCPHRIGDVGAGLRCSRQPY